MTDQQVLDRRIKLKRQAIYLIREEVKKLQLEASLLKLRHFFERQIDHAEDQRALSRYLEMIEALLQALREGK